MKTTIRLATAVAGIALGLNALPANAQTNGFEMQCLSARTSGQGCVTRAQRGIPSTLFRDPAGIVAFDHAALEINAAPFMPSLTFRNQANDQVVSGAQHVYPLGSVAYVGPRLADRLAWAVGIEPIGGFGSDFSLYHPVLSAPTGQPVDYQSFFAAVKAGPVLAVEVAPGLSVGGSGSAVYAQIRDFRMPFSMAPTAARGMGGFPQLDLQVYGPLFQQFTELTAYGDSKSYSGFGWSADLGIAYRHQSGLVVSGSWTPKTTITVDGGSAVIDMTAQFGQMMEAMVMARAQAYGETAQQAQAVVMQQLAAAGLDLQAGVVANYDAATDITLPMAVGVGLSAPLSHAWRLAAEVEWRQWSRAEATMPFRLTNGNNPNINLMMNGNPADGSFNYPFPLQWKDTYSGKIGTEYTLTSGNVLRAGYLYGQNPVPDNTVFITFPAIATHALTVGTTWHLGRFPLDVSYVHALQTSITGCTSGHAIGSEYLNSRTTMREHVLTLGTVWTFGR